VRALSQYFALWGTFSLASDFAELREEMTQYGLWSGADW
jgi:hypothetical protein